jgi:uncharacterized protein with NAD-binding domain and iron-sulfur cluster
MRVESVRFAVVGGGITGLAAAHRICELAAKRGEQPSVLVLESSDRAGGLIRSVRVDGMLLEGGPDSVGLPDCIRSGERAAEEAYAQAAEASALSVSAGA